MRRNQKPARSLSASITSAPPATPAPPETPAVSALSRFTDAAIILAALTFIGYWGAFSYETAYFEYFNIPYYFISLNLTAVFFASAGWFYLAPLVGLMLVWVAVWITVWNALEPVEERIKKRFPKSVKIVGILIAISGIAFFVFKFITDEEVRKVWTVETVLFGAAIFALVFLLGWLHKRYKEKKEESTWGLIALGVSGFLLFSYLEFRLLRAVGEDMAKNAKGFPVYMVPPPEVPVTPNPPTTPNASTTEVAVIRTSGDYLLTVPFNRGTKEFENKLILVKMSDSKTPLSLALQNIGPLHKPGTVPPKQ
jgi:hypothetical protein